MATMRFESAEKKSDKTPVKVVHFDSSPKFTLSQIYGLEDVILQNERKLNDETVYDVFGVRQNQTRLFAIGTLFHHFADWPGGPTKRNPVSAT